MSADLWAKRAFAALCVATAAGILLVPTYPNYDTYFALLWGKEILHGVVPHFEGFRLPTEHPLGIAAGAVLVGIEGAVQNNVYVVVAAAVLAVGGVGVGSAIARVDDLEFP